MRLAHKRAFVTAAGQGIGRASALAFCREGAEVIATDVNVESLSDLQRDEPRLDCRPLDVCNLFEIQQLADSVGRVDVLLNCAGYVHHGTILDCGEEDCQQTFEINVTAMFRIIKSFLPDMLAARRGSIINIASVVSSEKSAPHRFAYASSKAAVIGLTKSVAVDYVKQGVRCNAICPGTVLSPSLQQRIAAQGDYDEVLSRFVARQPMGRLGLPEEVAHLAVYLASDESAFTTGAVHLIDGGWSA